MHARTAHCFVRSYNSAEVGFRLALRKYVYTHMAYLKNGGESSYSNSKRNSFTRRTFILRKDSYVLYTDLDDNQMICWVCAIPLLRHTLQGSC